MLKEDMHCVYQLLRSAARSLIFRLNFLSTFFYKQKNFFNNVLTLNAIFFILLAM